MSGSRILRLAGLILLLVLVLVVRRWRESSGSGGVAPQLIPGDRAVPEEQVQALLQLEAAERHLEETLWKPELEAQRHEDVFNQLWDQLNASGSSLEPMGGVGFEKLQLPQAWIRTALAHSITRITPAPGALADGLSPDQWRERLMQWEREGWALSGSRWRLVAFVPATPGGAARSSVELTGRLVNSQRSQHATLRGRLEVEWKKAVDAMPPVPLSVRLDEPVLLVRNGPAPFEETLRLPVKSPSASPFVDPLLVGDLDGDGLSEIVLVGANQVLRNRRTQFVSEPLAALPADRIFSAVLIDWNRDGRLDLMVASGESLRVFPNDGKGRFPGTGEELWRAPAPLKHAQVLTTGDVQGDGRVDVWLGQYKLPYQGGQFPTPYFDANDGFPSFLLVQQPDGRLVDETESRGLGGRRNRRCYSASLLDADQDGDPDLVMVSDFAGVDLFLNDGKGHFQDETGRLGDTRHLFGMAHAWGDLNRDGFPDLLAMGMDSPVAARMDRLELKRAGFETLASRRAAMTAGNRFYPGSKRGLGRSEARPSLAEAGWAWGVTLLDADNDGDLDVSIVNGHETAPSVRDYERQFWLHDIFVAGSSNNPVSDLYFRSAQARRMADRASYGGWQANTFFLNQGAGDFLDIAGLAGLGLVEDSQNLVSDDLDGDGRMDLILTCYERNPGRPQSLRVMMNRLPGVGNWAGFRLDGLKGSASGCTVRIRTAAGDVQTRWVLNGDSYRSQHAPAVHFGIGGERGLLELEILWPDGTATRVKSPAVNQWHSISKP